MQLVKNKYVKISLKILLSIVVIFLLLLVIAGIYIKVNKDQIIADVTEEINNATNGETKIGDITFSVISNFPNIGVLIKHISILDSQYHKPLLQADEINIGIGFGQIFLKNKSIGKISVVNGSFHLFTDFSGYTNAYLLSKKNTDAKTKTPSSVTFKRVQLTNVNFLIENAPKEKKFECTASNLLAMIALHDTVWDITLSENIFVKGLGFNLANGSFLENQQVDSKTWHLRVNTASKDLSFDKSDVSINHQHYTLSGKFHLKDSAWFQLQAHTENIPFALAAQTLSKNITQKLNLIDLKQPITVDALLYGPLAKHGDPYITATVDVTNNQIETAVTSFTGCSFKTYFSNHIADSMKPCDANTNILFKEFTANWNGISLQTDSIFVKDLADPVISFSFLSHSSLKDLDSNLALSTLSLTGGTADIAMSYNGPLIADPSLLSNLDVKFILKDAEALYEPRNISFTKCSGEINITADSLMVNNLICNVEQNHFEVNAAGTNISRIASKDAGKIYLKIIAASSSINLADFISLFGEQKKVSQRRHKIQGLAITASKIDAMLERGTIEMNIKIGHIVNHNFTADNVNASLLFENNNWQVQQASLLHAGGQLQLKAGISEIKNNFHNVTANLKLSNVDVSKVFYAFNNFGLSSITSKNIRGQLTTTANLTMGFTNNGSIIPGTMTGTTDFSIRNGALIDYKPILQIQEYILKNRDLTNLSFAELKDKLIIQNDLVHINRMEIASSAIRFFVEGDYGITGNTNISIQVPFSNFLKKNNGDMPENKGVNARNGPSIYLRAKTGINGKVKLGLDLFGHRSKNKSKK